MTTVVATREMTRFGVRDGHIVEMSVHWTGDRSPQQIARHAEEVTLLRA